MNRQPGRSAIREGHRGRLRDRYRRISEAFFEDRELLELLLTFAIPRIDTRPAAAGLLERFGGLAGVFSANANQLQEVPGIGPEAALLLELITPLSARSLIPSRTARVFLSNPEEAAVFFRARLALLQEEEVHAAFVNARNAVTAVERLQTGTVDHSVVYPRKVLERALLHKASGFILAHNHPSGDVRPSQQDLTLTESLACAARSLGVRFLDHLIIGDGEPYSFRRNGLLS